MLEKESMDKNFIKMIMVSYSGKRNDILIPAYLCLGPFDEDENKISNIWEKRIHDWRKKGDVHGWRCVIVDGNITVKNQTMDIELLLENKKFGNQLYMTRTRDNTKHSNIYFFSFEISPLLQFCKDLKIPSVRYTYTKHNPLGDLQRSVLGDDNDTVQQTL